MKLRALGLIVTIILLVSGCSSGNDTATPIASGTPTAFTQVPWQFWDPADLAAPALLEKDSNSFKLKSGWEASTIEYQYNWLTRGTQTSEHEKIERNGTAYKLGTATIATADVQAFIGTLDHLYPTQLLLSGQKNSDDYPHWTIEISGTDGQRILLDSSSTGNPGYGPWNMLYNGRMYAQYDGSLGNAIGKLFGGRLADPSQAQTGTDVTYSTGALPPQLQYGFWGLLPVSSEFRYSIDVAAGNLTGQITEPSADGKTANDIDRLVDVTLMPVDHTITTCNVQEVVEDDPSVPVTSWKFTCQVNVGKQNSRYEYGIDMQFSKGGVTSDLTGGLYGAWLDDTNVVLSMPLPAELDAAFPKNNSVKELMTDDPLALVTYSAKVPAADPMQGERTGEAVFLGETEAYSQSIRYSMGTQFAVNNTELTYWTLDKPTLSAMLKTVKDLPTSERVIRGEPSLALNMWYAGAKTPTATFAPLPQGREPYSITVNSCGSVPGGTFPSATQPLQAFGFNMSPNLLTADFVLIDNKPVTVNQDTYFYTGLDPARAALVPLVFNTANSRAFQRIWLHNSSVSGNSDTLPASGELKLVMPSDAASSERDLYEKIAKSLPGTLAQDATGWTITGVTFVPNQDGTLGVIGCK